MVRHIHDFVGFSIETKALTLTACLRIAATLAKTRFASVTLPRSVPVRLGTLQGAHVFEEARAA